MKPDLTTRLEFGGKFESTIVDITADDVDIWINVRKDNEHEDKWHSIYLRPDEAEVFIAILTLFKNRILNPIRRVEE